MADFDRIYRNLWNVRSIGRIFYNRSHSKLVCRVNKTGFCSTKLALWPGLDNAIHNTGDFGIFNLAKKENPARITALKIFSIQLIANTFWSIIFFGLHQPLLALVDILILWVLIILMVWKFYKIDKTAGLLQIPYLLWVSFASILNLMIVLLN